MQASPTLGSLGVVVTRLNQAHIPYIDGHPKTLYSNSLSGHIEASVNIGSSDPRIMEPF